MLSALFISSDVIILTLFEDIKSSLGFLLDFLRFVRGSVKDPFDFIRSLKKPFGQISPERSSVHKDLKSK